MECYHCGRVLEPQGKVMRQDTCPGCHAFLHCCRNCRFHDPAAHNGCREPAAEWVSDAQSANFCEYFEPAMDTVGDGGGPGAGRDAFERLFRK
ncbi:MAG: hypothetical protein PVF68_16050 [Acidobacteriota bacterium]